MKRKLGIWKILYNIKEEVMWIVYVFVIGICNLFGSDIEILKIWDKEVNIVKLKYIWLEVLLSII